MLLGSIFTTAGFFAVLTVTAWAAHSGGTLRRGLLRGILAGSAATFILSAAGAFLGYLVPFAQLEFWLAALLS